MSVIIPCFNRSADLRRALLSVQAQSFTDIEVVVGDDASTEDLRAVVAGIDDPRFRVARREQNGGIGAGRNVAIADARGELLAFLDSDDEWRSDHLALAVAALDAAVEPVVAVCTAFEMHYPSGRVDRRVPAPHVDLVSRTVRGVDLSAGSTMLLRADAMAAIGPWPEDIPRNEDYDWFLRMGLAGYDLAIVPDVTVVIHANDRAALDLAASRRSHRLILERNAPALRARRPALARHLRAKLHEELAWAAWRNRRLALTAREVALAVALDPASRLPKLARSARRRLG